jgi:hypothetical protein
MNWKILKILLPIMVIAIIGILIWLIVPKATHIEDIKEESVEQEIRIIYPNGGEVLEHGENHMIQWTNPNQKQVLIELYKDDERIDGIIISRIEGIEWSIGNLKFPEIFQGDKFKLQILDNETYEILDESDDYFSIRIPIGYLNGKIYNVNITIEEAQDDLFANRFIYQDNLLRYEIDYPEEWDYYAHSSEDSSLVKIAPKEVIVNHKNNIGGDIGIGPGHIFEIRHVAKNLEEDRISELSNNIMNISFSAGKIDGLNSYNGETRFNVDYYGWKVGDKTISYIIPFNNHYLDIVLLDPNYNEILEGMIKTLKLEEIN